MIKKENESKLLKAILKLDPSAEGFIKVTEDPNLLISGSIYSNVLSENDVKTIIEKIFEDSYNKSIVIISLVVKNKKNSLSIINDDTEEVFSSGTEVDEREGAYLDEVKVIYQGNLSVDVISPTNNLKRRNIEFFDRLRAVHDAIAFTTPLVLDRNLNIIDGNLRLEIAKMNGIKEIPVIVVDSDPVKSAFLKLLINRSGEFQKWVYPEVDEVVDRVPQLQPLLEPFGFFSNKILPVSFFSDTILNYHIDEFNEQQSKYLQDETLESWAAKRRDIAYQREAEKEKNRNKKRNKDGLKSLFDLEPKESDFLDSFSATESLEESVKIITDMSASITETFDEERRKEKEAAGEKWQLNRRTTRQKAEDARREAMKRKESKDDE